MIAVVNTHKYELVIIEDNQENRKILHEAAIEYMTDSEKTPNCDKLDDLLKGKPILHRMEIHKCSSVFVYQSEW